MSPKGRIAIVAIAVNSEITGAMMKIAVARVARDEVFLGGELDDVDDRLQRAEGPTRLGP